MGEAAVDKEKVGQLEEHASEHRALTAPVSWLLTAAAYRSFATSVRYPCARLVAYASVALGDALRRPWGAANAAAPRGALLATCARACKIAYRRGGPLRAELATRR